MYTDIKNPRYDLEKALVYYRRAALGGDNIPKECVTKTLKKLKQARSKAKTSRRSQVRRTVDSELAD